MSLLRSRHDNAIYALAVPAIGGLAVDPLVSLVDTAFVGQLGTIPLAALGVNASLFAFTFLIFNFLAYGTTPRVGRALGSGNVERAGELIVEALTLALVAGLVALGVLQLFAEPLLDLMGATGELREPALEYLRIRAFAGPAVLFITAGRGAFRGFQDTKTPLRIAVLLNLVNLVLDPLFIFGFGWGLAGAATATLIAQWVGAFAYLFLLLYRNAEQMGVQWKLPTLANLLPFLGIGGTLLFRTGALVGTMTLATAVATRIGVVEVAAHQIAVQLWLFMALVVDALAVAGQALVSKQLGEGDDAEALSVANRLLVLGLGAGILLGLSFAALSPFLPVLFSDDPKTIEMVLGIFVFVAILQPLNGLVFVWDGVFMGKEDFRFLAAAMLFSAGCAAAVLLSVLPFELGLEGVWWGMTVLMLTRIVTLAWRHLRWSRDVAR